MQTAAYYFRFLSINRSVHTILLTGQYLVQLITSLCSTSAALVEQLTAVFSHLNYTCEQKWNVFFMLSCLNNICNSPKTIAFHLFLLIETLAVNGFSLLLNTFQHGILMAGWLICYPS